MAAPEGTKQVTLFIPTDTLEKVDDAAYAIRKRRNDRTTWVLKAIDEKIARDEAVAGGMGEPVDEQRVREIVNVYGGMNDAGKEWLYRAAMLAGSADEFN